MKMHKRIRFEIASRIVRTGGHGVLRGLSAEFRQNSRDGARPAAMHSKNDKDVRHFLLDRFFRKRRQKMYFAGSAGAYHAPASVAKRLTIELTIDQTEWQLAAVYRLAGALMARRLCRDEGETIVRTA